MGLGGDGAVGSTVGEIESNIVSVFAIGSLSGLPDLGVGGLGLGGVGSLWGSWVLESIKGGLERGKGVSAGRSGDFVIDLAMSMERIESWEGSSGSNKGSKGGELHILIIYDYKYLRQYI